MALQEGVEKGVLDQSDITTARLARFLSSNGRRFYGLPPADAGKKIVLEQKGEAVKELIASKDGSIQVAVSRGGHTLHSLRWETS